jgi:hypothetical protein
MVVLAGLARIAFDRYGELLSDVLNPRIEGLC